MKFLSLISLIFILYSINLHAGIYKWIDEAGHIHYSQQKPSDIAVEEMHIKSFQGVVIEEIQEKPVPKHINHIRFKQLNDQKKLLCTRLNSAQCVKKPKSISKKMAFDIPTITLIKAKLLEQDIKKWVPKACQLFLSVKDV